MDLKIMQKGSGQQEANKRCEDLKQRLKSATQKLDDY